jgi:hypothetical protein
MTVAEIVEALYPVYLWEHRDPARARAEVAKGLAALQRAVRERPRRPSPIRSSAPAPTHASPTLH